MKYFLSFVLTISFCLLSSQPLVAQETAQARYVIVDYFKVAPGQGADYLAMEKAWKKIHQSNIEKGHYQLWALERVLFPNGSSAEYNYITRTHLEGNDELAAYMDGVVYPESDEELASLLSKSELEIVERTGSFREHIKTEVFVYDALSLSEAVGDAKVNVFNFFALPPDASMSSMAEMEKELWMPVQEARIKDGKMAGWVSLLKMQPQGSHETYVGATVDIYVNMQDYLDNGNPVDYVKKQHTGDAIEEFWQRTEDNSDRIRSEVRVTLDMASKEN